MEKLLISACLVWVACRHDGRRLDRRQCAERILRLSGRYHLVPVCPEQLGGLPTPRAKMFFTPPVEGTAGPGPARVVDENGTDRTDALAAGADECLKLALALGIKKALLKERSPSCGVRRVYLGDSLIPGEGLTTRALKNKGIEVISDEEEE